MLHIIFLLLSQIGMSSEQKEIDYSITNEMNNVFSGEYSDNGHITICSNSVSYSQSMHQIIYEGDVVVIHTKGTEVLCNSYNTRNRNNYFKYLLPRINIENNYKKSRQSSIIYAESVCEEQQGCLFLVGQKLIIFLNEQNSNINKIVLISKMPYINRFYSLPFSKTLTHGGANLNELGVHLYAEGKYMDFDLLNSTLTVQGDAYIEKKGNQFSGHRILYDIRHALLIAPDTGRKVTFILNKLDMK